MNIDPSSGLPFYLQIVQQIKTAVAMGRLQPEEPLPSVRHLAVGLAVNLVLHAEESLKVQSPKVQS
jgi:GntR family transcriptional regulator